MKNLKYYLQKAEGQGWAIGQFGFYDETMLKGIVSGCSKLRSPAILGTSERAVKSLGGLKRVVKMVEQQRKATGSPLFLNLDHAKSFKYIKKGIDAGYNAVHFDGSKLDIKDNIKNAKKIVKYAKRHGVLVEGEVGVIGGKLTDLNDVLKFVKAVRVDALAVSIGSIHGIKKPGRPNPPLKLKKLKQIRKKTGNIPLVLHGGSGTSPSDVKKAIKLGVVKVNVSTAIRQAKTLSKVQKKVEEKIKLLGSNNKL